MSSQGLKGIKTIRDFELAGKSVFLRLDLNVPLENGKITDETRITATLPTIRYALEKGAKLVIASHLGRPKSAKDKQYSMEPVAKRLGEILKLQSLVPIQDPVEKIYINLATDTDPEYYHKFGRRTLATYDTFQVALDLVQDQRLSLEDLGVVIESLVTKYDYSVAQMVKSFEDLIRRRILGLSSFEMIKNFLIERKIISLSWTSKSAPLKEKIVENGHVYQLEGLFEPWVPKETDYLRDLF